MLGFFLRASSGVGDPRVPVGGILLYTSTTPPAGGWEYYSAGNGRALIGAASAGEVGVNAGPATGRIELTGTTDEDGAHNGTSFNGEGEPGPGSTGYYNGNGFSGAHTHTFSLNRTYGPAKVGHPLIRKTGDVGPIPAGASVFGAGALPSAALDEIATYIGRVLQANNSVATIAAIDATGAYSHGTSVDGSHVHGSYTVGISGPEFSPVVYPDGPAGAHSHVVSGSVSAVSLPVGRVAHFQANAETVVPVGAVIGFNGDESNIKDGWVLCDGSNGSIDLRDRFLEIAASGDAGVLEGDGTVTWTATVASAGDHDHDGPPEGTRSAHTAGHSNETGAHTHGWDARSGVINIYRHSVRFIQYLP